MNTGAWCSAVKDRGEGPVHQGAGDCPREQGGRFRCPFLEGKSTHKKTINNYYHTIMLWSENCKYYKSWHNLYSKLLYKMGHLTSWTYSISTVILYINAVFIKSIISNRRN